MKPESLPTTEAEQPSLLEWVAAFSAELHAAKEFEGLYARQQDRQEGCVGFWQYCIEVAQDAHRLQGAMERGQEPIVVEEWIDVIAAVATQVFQYEQARGDLPRGAELEALLRKAILLGAGRDARLAPAAPPLDAIARRPELGPAR